MKYLKYRRPGYTLSDHAEMVRKKIKRKNKIKRLLRNNFITL